MTLPSEGINPWRVAPAPGGTGAHPAKHTPAQLPDLRIGKDDALDASDKTADGRPAGGKEFKAFGDDGLTFWDLVDVINPLQHIPVVSTLYREMTNDTLDPAPRIIGGTLFMGPIGLVASSANVMIEHNTGKDMGSHVLAYFRDDAQPLATKTAAAAPAAAGTDGTDPVTQWAAQQTAFYRGADTAADPVSRWAADQQAFYQGRDGAGSGAAATAAAGTDGADVTAWAAQQVAYYQGGETQPVTATDPVAAWAQRQTAYYRAGAETGPARAAQPRAQAIQTAQAASATVNHAGIDGDVSTWARNQLAWVMGDRAKEVAALPEASPRDRTAPRRADAGRGDQEPSGAVAEGGGWFRTNMVQGWTRYQAAQRLAEPGFRPDLNLAAGDR